MSIQSEIDRIIRDKEELRVALVDKGATLTAGAMLSDFTAAVSSLVIPEGEIDLPSVTFTADKLLVGYTALDSDGQVVHGDMGYADYTVESDLQGSSTDPELHVSVSVANSGYITSEANKTETINLIEAGLATKSAQTYTPGTSDKSIDAGLFLTGTQTIKGDANLIAANIVKGKTIFGVSGSFEGGSGGFDTADATANPSDVANGAVFYNAAGRQTGSMPKAQIGDPEVSLDTADNVIYVSVNVSEGQILGDNSEEQFSYSLNDIFEVENGGTTIRPTTQEITIPGGRYLLNDITIAGDANLRANNIKSGVSIFGVSGTYEGSGGGGGSAEGASPAKLFCATLIY